MGFSIATFTVLVILAESNTTFKLNDTLEDTENTLNVREFNGEQNKVPSNLVVSRVFRLKIIFTNHTINMSV